MAWTCEVRPRYGPWVVTLRLTPYFEDVLQRRRLYLRRPSDGAVVGIDIDTASLRQIVLSKMPVPVETR